MRQNIQVGREVAGGAGEAGGAAGVGRRSAAAQSGFKMASLVAFGMLLSRIAGLVRESVFAHYFGNSDAADAFKAAFRIPNILQNLFGEGVLSASFIPVYSRLLGAGEEEHANVLAWTLGAILSLTISVLVLIGVAAAPYLIDAIAPGFHGSKRELTTLLVRVLFPGAGLLVMSAWCLGVLNSHHRFFASYTAPVAWNLAIIGFLLFYGPHHTQDRLAVLIAWGSVVGSALQVGVQLPQAMRLAGRLRVDFRRTAEALRAVLNNFLPIVTGRGVVQISAYIDNLLASLLPTGAVAALNYAQILYLLPVSLFGMSVAAAELPGMSRATGTQDEIANVLRGRLNMGLRQIAFFVIPSAAAFLFLGDVIAGAIFQSGHFTRADALYVWGILAGSAVGLLAVTMGRLYSSAFYALWDTRTPLKFAVIRVILTVALGYYCALYLPPVLGIDRHWGVAGLTASAGLAGWVEFSLLRWALNRRIGKSGLHRTLLIELWAMALAASGAGYVLKLYLHGHGPKLVALGVIPVFAAAYLGLAWVFRIEELNLLAARILPRRQRGLE
ncbi:MAG TPA: murein biosynthesis integral membrane protein MurJ [Candidatus Binataceae bacterium]|nr:murein biosynthesis integral membrane protein MurJ [Candidatus Binataceae bacterium]